MKSKDQELLAEAYNKVLKEQTTETSIGNELYKLYTELEPNAMTKSGARASEVLKMILDELNEVVDKHKRYADSEPWEALQSLLSKLAID